MTYVVVSALVALLIGVSAELGGGTSGTRPDAQRAVRNGVIYACVETKGDRATIGDLKLGHCHKGFKRIAWNIRAPRALAALPRRVLRASAAPPARRATTGSTAPRRKGRQGRQGRQGRSRPARLRNLRAGPLREPRRTGCFSGTEVWAHDTNDRLYVVNAAQDGTGYFVTRYDIHGTFTTVPGAHHPGDCANTFASADAGTFNGVWTRKITGTFDFNPDATMPTSGSWDDFIAAFFARNGESPTVTEISYEFDYYNACGDHWRDAAYPAIVGSGSIGDCPR